MTAHDRIAILKLIARFMTPERNSLALLFAREGCKPLVDAQVEVDRAINGVELAAVEITNLSDELIPAVSTPGIVSTTSRVDTIVGLIIATPSNHKPWLFAILE